MPPVGERDDLGDERLQVDVPRREQLQRAAPRGRRAREPRGHRQLAEADLVERDLDRRAAQADLDEAPAAPRRREARRDPAGAARALDDDVERLLAGRRGRRRQPEPRRPARAGPRRAARPASRPPRPRPSRPGPRAARSRRGRRTSTRSPTRDRPAGRAASCTRTREARSARRPRRAAQSGGRWRLCSGHDDRGAKAPSTCVPIDRRSGRGWAARRGSSGTPRRSSSTSRRRRGRRASPRRRPAPSSSTTPQTSWPIVTGGTLGYSPASMCRSVPQIPAARTATRTWPASSGRDGRSLRPTWPAPAASFVRPSTSPDSSRAPTPGRARSIGRRMTDKIRNSSPSLPRFSPDTSVLPMVIRPAARLTVRSNGAVSFAPDEQSPAYGRRALAAADKLWHDHVSPGGTREEDASGDPTEHRDRVAGVILAVLALTLPAAASAGSKARSRPPPEIRYNVLVVTTSNDATAQAGVAAIKAAGQTAHAKFKFYVNAPAPGDAGEQFSDKRLDKFRSVVFLDTGRGQRPHRRLRRTRSSAYFNRGGGAVFIGSAIETDPSWQFLTDALGARAVHDRWRPPRRVRRHEHQGRRHRRLRRRPGDHARQGATARRRRSRTVGTARSSRHRASRCPHR